MSSDGYERLPGRGRHIAGMDYLWLAADHLLLARQRAYTETYQRFFFNDIQALVLRRTRVRAGITVVLGALGLLCVLFAWITTWAPIKIFWGVTLALLLLAGLVNWFRGPTTSCHLSTQLQEVALRSLGRERVARRVLARLKREIEGSQGDIASIAAEPTLPGGTPDSAVQMAPVSARRSRRPPPLPTTYNGFWHFLLFVSLLVDSAGTSWQLASPSTLAAGIGVAVALVEIGLAITAVLRQRVVRVSRRLRLLTQASLVFLILLMVAGWISAMVMSFQAALNAATTGGPIEQATLRTQLAPLSWASIVGTTTLGIAGLFAVLGERSRRGMRALD